VYKLDANVLKSLLDLALSIDFNVPEQSINDVHSGAIVVLSSLIGSASKDNYVVVYNFSQTIFETIEKSLITIMNSQEQLKNNIDVEQNTSFIEKMFNIHDYLISLLSSFYEGDVQYFDQEQNEKALEMVLKSFELKGLFVDGICFIENFYSLLRLKGVPYLSRVKPALLAALDNYMNFELCQCALNCISFIVLELEEHCDFMIDEVAIKCFNILQVSIYIHKEKYNKIGKFS
jgi:hypothetical protein